MKKVGSFISTYYKHPIAIALYVIILIAIIYYYGKSKGGFTSKKPPKDTNWGKDLTEEESTKIRTLMQRLYRDMTSYWVSSGFKDRDCEAYNQLITSSDRVIVGVYNDFNENYYSEDDGTLTNWIEDESFATTAGCSSDLKEAVLLKLESLNLTRKS